MPGSPHARGPSVTRNPLVYSEVTVPQVTPTTSQSGPGTLREQRKPGAQLPTVPPAALSFLRQYVKHRARTRVSPCR